MKRYIIPQQIIGPPKLRTSASIWEALELFAKKPSKNDPKVVQYLTTLLRKTKTNKIK